MFDRAVAAAVWGDEVNNPTNTPRGFHVETTWKQPFPRRFNVESTWCVCREGAYYMKVLTRGQCLFEARGLLEGIR